MAIEIERKWLIHDMGAIPDTIDYIKVERIRQAYILNKDRHVLRVRSSMIDIPENKMRRHFTEATVTVKGPSDTGYADEYEMKIPFAFAERFMEGQKVLEKTRKSFKIGNDILVELDVFSSIKGLVIAEVEFSSMGMADYFLTPSWFGREVTFDAAYSNANLYKTIGG